MAQFGRIAPLGSCRVYDPEIGRFLSADPHVQEVDNHQNWNRYSYVLNNPLSYTDPTGYFFKKLFGKNGSSGSFWKKLGNLLKVALKAIVQIAACFYGGPWGCAAAAGAMTLAEGGSLSQALKAAAFAFISAHVFSAISPYMKELVALHGAAGEVIKAGIHGVIQGALNVAQGGSFMQGFASGAMGSLGGYFSEGIVGNDPSAMFASTVISAAFGCAGAVISGGKCAEGAASAAIANLYNRWAGGASALKDQFDEFQDELLEEVASKQRLMRRAGHHMMPNKALKDIAADPKYGAFSAAAVDVFDTATGHGGGRLNVPGHNVSPGHAAYTKDVTAYAKSWIDAKGIALGAMTADQARMLIRDINMQPNLAQFNRSVFVRGMNQWFKRLPPHVRNSGQ